MGIKVDWMLIYKLGLERRQNGNKSRLNDKLLFFFNI